MAADFVLDTFAVMAFIRGEAGRKRVRDLLEQSQRGEIVCRISAISVGEAAYIVERRSGIEGVRRMLAELDQARVAIEDATWTRILAAAHMKALHQMSYADAFAVALAQEFGATVVTGDPEFNSVEHLVSVEWLPRV